MRKCASDVIIFTESPPQYTKCIYQCFRYFKAEFVSKHFSAWKYITADQEVLQNIQEIKLEFEESPLRVECLAFEIPNSQLLIQEEENKLLKKVVVECEHDAVENILQILLRKNTDGIKRIFINSISANKYLEYKYFKIHTLQLIVTWQLLNSKILTTQ